ncbi:hypothetical protein D1007_31747 [Hordeum vulgare]|nr:hypothetical protein D1007_31747 [Hordeum vulgare]
MAHAGKQTPKTPGPVPAPPLLECTLSKDVDLTSVLPWTAADSNEHGRTLICPNATAKRPASKALLSVFAFYYEAFIGVRPSVALFRHFFSMRLHDGTHLSACVSFLPAQGMNLLLKAGKKVENLRHRLVFMSLKDANPQLEVLKGLPGKTSAWSSAKLSDPRVVPILERFSHDISNKRLTGGMIVKEFLAQHLAPIQAHSKPLWDYPLGDDKLSLRS